MHNRKEFGLTRIMTLLSKKKKMSKKKKKDGNKELSEYSQELFNMKSTKGKAREDIIWLKSGYFN